MRQHSIASVKIEKIHPLITNQGEKTKMAPKRNIGPRVSDKTREWLADNFSSISAGAEHVLECHRVLYARTLQELKGEFTRGEIMAMIDVMNAHAMTPFASGSELPLALNGSYIDGLAEKWEIDGSELDTKLSLLSIYQVACLEWWANGFWCGGGSEREERDIEKYVAVLAMDRPSRGKQGERGEGVG